MTKIESAFSGVMVCPGDIWVADLVVSSGILLTVKPQICLFLPPWLFVFLWLLLCGHDRDIGAFFSANYLN